MVITEDGQVITCEACGWDHANTRDGFKTDDKGEYFVCHLAKKKVYTQLSNVFP